MKQRLHVLDALRGFAIVSIMLLHNIEHFDFYYTPENLPEWIKPIDGAIWDSLFFLFSGKAFAIFALLFGLTFFIQFNNQANRGRDFRPRFAWRMLLLFAFGMVNSVFFQGDILTIYAAIGLFLIPLAKAPTKTLFIFALLLLCNPLEIVNLVTAVQNPTMEISNPKSWTYFGRMAAYITGDNMLETFKGNLVNGKTAVMLWSYEAGRYTQILGLFILGMLAGRMQYFQWNDQNKKFWKRILLYAAIVFIPLHFFISSINGILPNEVLRNPVYNIVNTWKNLSFMLVLVAAFVLTFHSAKGFKILNIFSSAGKMSLSNYVFQSIIGSTIYYGYGLGLYQYTGATYALFIGIVLSVISIALSYWWMQAHKHGPLETIWHAATWIKPFQKQQAAATVKNI